MSETASYRHLHLRGLGTASSEFRAPGGGQPDIVEPVENRPAHAAKLIDDLRDATAEIDAWRAAQGRYGVPPTKRGLPVTVEGRPGVRLRVGQARSARGLALFNVVRGNRPGSGDNGDTDAATLFVTASTLKSLLAGIEAYGRLRSVEAADDDDEEGHGSPGPRPTRIKLFESSAGIRAATLRDLWTDRSNPFPRRKDETRWEVWTRAGFQEPFERVVERLGLRTFGGTTEFFDTVVRSVIATPAQVDELVRGSAAVVELRSACQFASSFFDLATVRKAATVRQIASRLEGPGADAPRVAILDTGVLRTHALLKGALPVARCFAADGDWEVTDHDGHGTKVAGIVQYGNLRELPGGTSKIRIATRLESVMVAGPAGSPPVAARDALAKAVQLVEGARGPRVRVYCLAQTAEGEADDGRPTSTSAALDQLAFGDGERTRLFCAAVGNAPHSDDEPYQLVDYADRNAEYRVQSPAQALNALSIGAVSLAGDGVATVAPAGDLAPTSRTSEGWAKSAASGSPDVGPGKPDIVLDGGNFLISDDGMFCHPSPAHLRLTTGIGELGNSLALAGETSAATAAAAGLAGRLLAQYPHFRMETVRALMVNSAKWTPGMLRHADAAQAAGLSQLDARMLMLRRFGWGVPDEGLLFRSAANALTLVAEDSLEPYTKSGNNLRLKQMKYFRLPWPAQALRALSNTDVEMRCTLSYLVEPEPHASSRGRSDRYPSHRLRFDFRRSGETHGRTQSRANLLAEDGSGDVDGADTGWFLGFKARQRGALHTDIWTGPARELAQRDGISVAPVKGWWGDVGSAGREDRKVNFSLVVSIRTPAAGSGDLYAETAAMVRPALLVEPATVAVET